MKKSGSIRNKLLAAIFIGCLIPYVLGGAYLKSYTEDWLYKNSIDNTNQMLYRITDLIDESLVVNMKQEIRLLSSLDSVKNAKYNLQNYTRYDRNTFRYNSSETEKTIEEHFRLLKSSNDTIHFVFLATADGGYMEYPRFQAKQAYEPRLRPWYLSTIHKEDVQISEPYLTKMSNEMVVGFTKQILDEKGNVSGVLGITVNLYDLTTGLNNIKIGDSGYILLLSPEQKFLVSPYHREWIMKTPEELKLSGFDELGRAKEVVFESKVDGIDCVMNAVTSGETGWHIVSVVEKNEILQKSRAMTNILLIIYALTLALIFVIVYQISRRFTNPILEISYIINGMTDFNFRLPNDLTAYARQNDEVGVVATALVKMHDNFTEFIDQVKYIDKEIQNIDIEKNELLKVEVSRNNPFHGVIDSMNNLLAKLHQYFNELNFLALHDPLTKLPNRRQFIDLLEAKLSERKKGAVIMLDLDDFKGINDTLGHVFGDRVIETVAVRLKETAGKHVWVSRFGGDEFLLYTERTGTLEEIEQLISRIRESFRHTLHVENNDIEIRFSMGITLFPEDGTDVNQLIINADLAMYSVKDSGKNGYRYFNSSMMNSQVNKSRIELLLREAIENDGFELVYQPQIDLKGGAIRGYEALLRLKGSDLLPGDFVPVAEINGSIIRIGRIVTEKVIKQLADWKKAGMELKPVSINFSANQLLDSGYLSLIGQMLEKYEIPPRYIEIEVTESIFLENQHATLAFMKKLKEMGIAISIDDFGTGYSSLNYLTFLPVDKVKLDRSLNIRFLEMENTGTMKSLISLAHSLGLSVTAEGIEALDQVERLKDAECDFIQGYYYSVPLKPEQISGIHHSRFE